MQVQVWFQNRRQKAKKIRVGCVRKRQPRVPVDAQLGWDLGTVLLAASAACSSAQTSDPSEPPPPAPLAQLPQPPASLAPPLQPSGLVESFFQDSSPDIDVEHILGPDAAAAQAFYSTS